MPKKKKTPDEVPDQELLNLEDEFPVVEVTQVSNSCLTCAAGESVEMHQSGAMLVAGDEIYIDQGGGFVIAADNVEIRDGGAFLVLAEKVEGEYTTVFTPVTAAIAGGAFAFVTWLLSQMFRPRRR